MLSDDTLSLRHLPRRSSKNCDLQFANSDRFKANYSVDRTKHMLKTIGSKWKLYSENIKPILFYSLTVARLNITSDNTSVLSFSGVILDCLWPRLDNVYIDKKGSLV